MSDEAADLEKRVVRLERQAEALRAAIVRMMAAFTDFGEMRPDDHQPLPRHQSLTERVDDLGLLVMALHAVQSRFMMSLTAFAKQAEDQLEREYARVTLDPSQWSRFTRAEFGDGNASDHPGRRPTAIYSRERTT